jgi:hypothetical protein
VHSPGLLPRHEAVLVRYARAQHLAGTAARDVSLRMNDAAGADRLAGEIASTARTLATEARARIARPSALFWRHQGHIDLLAELEESARRLEVHCEMLRAGPSIRSALLGSAQAHE